LEVLQERWGLRWGQPVGFGRVLAGGARCSSQGAAGCEAPAACSPIGEWVAGVDPPGKAGSVDEVALEGEVGEVELCNSHPF
jgi:hypothetical protein